MLQSPRRVRPPIDHPVGLKPRGALTFVIWVAKSVFKTFTFCHPRAASTDFKSPSYGGVQASMRSTTSATHDKQFSAAWRGCVSLDRTTHEMVGW